MTNTKLQKNLRNDFLASQLSCKVIVHDSRAHDPTYLPTYLHKYLYRAKFKRMFASMLLPLFYLNRRYVKSHIGIIFVKENNSNHTPQEAAIYLSFFLLILA